MRVQGEGCRVQCVDVGCGGPRRLARPFGGMEKIVYQLLWTPEGFTKVEKAYEV